MEDSYAQSSWMGCCKSSLSSLSLLNRTLYLRQDFDGGLVGQGVVQALSTPNKASRVTWTVVSASHFSSVEDVARAIHEEQVWTAITST